MKRRLEKQIRARMLANPHENYNVARLIVLEQERNSKMRFRTGKAQYRVPVPSRVE